MCHSRPLEKEKAMNALNKIDEITLITNLFEGNYIHPRNIENISPVKESYDKKYYIFFITIPIGIPSFNMFEEPLLAENKTNYNNISSPLYISKEECEEERQKLMYIIHDRL